MEEGRAEEIERLLRAAAAGDAVARTRVFALVYEELKRIAAAMLRLERTGHTLQTTDLVDEAYLRMLGERKTPANEHHFVRTAARAMRRILVDHAKARDAAKRGGDRVREDLLDELPIVLDHPLDVLAVDEALLALELEDARAAEVVTLRLFAGLTLERIGAVMELPLSTVRRLFEASRALLSKRLAPPES